MVEDSGTIPNGNNMIKKKNITKYLLLDIETASQYPTLEELREADQKLADLWVKRHVYYSGSYFEFKDSTPDQTYKAKAQLEPEFGKIVCVTFGSFKDESEDARIMSFSGSELDILEKVKKILQNAMVMNFLLCGHNIKNFDIPWIGKRMLYNGINPPDIIKVGNKKPWELSFVDTAELLSFGSWVQQKSLSLDLLCHSLGIKSPKGGMDGSMVSESFHNGRIEEIVSYCERDVEALGSILQRIAD